MLSIYAICLAGLLSCARQLADVPLSSTTKHFMHVQSMTSESTATGC